MRTVLPTQHQVYPHRRGSSMPELQGEALQVLPHSRERRFGNEDRAFGSASHEDRRWGTDKSAGKEGGC